MRFLRQSDEAETIAQFLRQEYASVERYGARLSACLRAEGVDPEVITAPDIADADQNAARRRLLRRYRGYGSGQPSYFTDFPTEGVSWWWVALTPEELLDTRYIRYEFWTQLSGGTRSPRAAADRIRAEFSPTDESAEGFLQLADALRKGLRVPPLILVSADEGNTRVVLEGHARLTAYALAPETIPDSCEVLLGMAPAIANWDEY